MTIPMAYKGKYFFHFTHIENLEQIIDHGLLSSNMKQSKKIFHKNIAIDEIQARRSSMDVPVGPGGVIHDYVPFYFCARTPMLLSVLNTKNIDQYFLIHIAVSIEKLLRPEFIFTDSSANRREPPSFFSDPTDLDKLNWDIIGKRSWKATGIEKSQKMAEVLCYKNLCLKDVDYIVVWNEQVKKMVEDKFKEKGVTCPLIKFDGEGGYRHWVTWFGGDGEEGCSIVTGPEEMKTALNGNFEKILETRSNLKKEECVYLSLNSLIGEIEAGFERVPEIKEIVGLRTSNPKHKENVDVHTITVVEELKKLKGFQKQSERNQEILLLCAYMHDVGKGPANRWKTGVQKTDDTHSRRSLDSVSRVLMNDVFELSKNEIYTILFLVAYHDLTGDCITRKRNYDCIKGLDLNHERLKLLNLLNYADSKSLCDDIDMCKWKEIKDKLKGLLDD